MRLLRGVAAAVAATFIAAFSHVDAGGPPPDGTIILLSLALSGLVCTALAGRSLSLWRLSAAVVLSQALFHGLFSLGASSHAAKTGLLVTFLPAREGVDLGNGQRAYRPPTRTLGDADGRSPCLSHGPSGEHEDSQRHADLPC